MGEMHVTNTGHVEMVAVNNNIVNNNIVNNKIYNGPVAPPFRIANVNTNALRRLGKTNYGWYRRVQAETIPLTYQPEANYRKIWIACCQKHFKYKLIMVEAWKLPAHGARHAESIGGRIAWGLGSVVMYPTAVAFLPLHAVFEGVVRAFHTTRRRCSCGSCADVREQLFNTDVRPFHPELRFWRS